LSLSGPQVTLTMLNFEGLVPAHTYTIVDVAQ
jgi:hypothetical protein